MKKNKPCKLLLSLLFSFSFLFLPVFAEDIPDDYGISVLSFADDTHIGYFGLVDTGLDEWRSTIDSFNSVFNSQVGDSYYIVWQASGQDLRMVYNAYFDSNYGYFRSDDGWHCTAGVCSAYSGYLNVASNAIVAMNLPQSGYENFVNWNAVSWEQAVAYYENSDSSQASTQDILDAIVDGTESSADSADVADSANLDLKDVIDEYDSIEQSYIQDFNTNLHNIDVGGFSWDSSFLTSASWVTTQFNELVMETPFESLITFSLIIGITLYLIGRYKG